MVDLNLTPSIITLKINRIGAPVQLRMQETATDFNFECRIWECHSQTIKKSDNIKKLHLLLSLSENSGHGATFEFQRVRRPSKKYQNMKRFTFCRVQKEQAPSTKKARKTQLEV